MKNRILTIWLFVISITVSTSAQAYATFKISSYNIRNFSQLEGHELAEKEREGATDPTALALTLKESKSDIMTFQEIINASLFEQVLAQQFPTHRLLVTECGGTAEQKVALAYDEKVFKLERYDEEWRVSLSTRCNFGLRPALVAWLKHIRSGKRIAVIVVHLKAGSGDRNRATRRDQHLVLNTVIEELQTQNFDDIILTGDFNTTSFIEQTPGAQQFEEFLKENKLKNLTSKVGCSSYWQGAGIEQTMVPSHLDHILHKGNSRFSVSASLGHCRRNKCEEASRDALGATFNHVSDHCPIQAEIRFNR